MRCSRYWTEGATICRCDLNLPALFSLLLAFCGSASNTVGRKILRQQDPLLIHHNTTPSDPATRSLHPVANTYKYINQPRHLIRRPIFPGRPPAELLREEEVSPGGDTAASSRPEIRSATPQRWSQRDMCGICQVEPSTP